MVAPPPIPRNAKAAPGGKGAAPQRAKPVGRVGENTGRRRWSNRRVPAPPGVHGRIAGALAQREGRAKRRSQKRAA
jgi:hypothetical protein